MANIVVSSTPIDPAIVPEEPLADYLLRMLAARLPTLGDALWFEDVTSGATVRFCDVEDHSRRIASALARRGFRQGDVLYFITYEMAQLYVVILAVWRLGGAVRGWFQADTTDVYIGQMRQSRVKFALVDIDTASAVRKASKALEWPVNFLSFGGVEGATSLTELLQDDGSALPSQVTINVREDVAFIPSTSGSTGPPKGVLHTHYTGLSGLYNTPNVVWGNESVAPAMMSLLVNFAIGSFWLMLRSLTDGRKVITIGKFKREEFVDVLIKHKPKSVMMYQYVACWLARHPALQRGELGFLQSVNVAAWVLDPGTVRNFRKHMPRLVLGQGYGLTEIIGVSSTLLCGKDETGVEYVPFIENQGDVYASSGRLAPFVKAKVIDPESGAVLGRGERGEILVHTPCLMLGYLRVGHDAPDLTGCLDEEGWYRTGDLGFIGEEGDLVIIERLSYTYKSAGHTVAPSDIEAVLQEHPAVHNSGVVGVPCGSSEDHVSRAFVVLRPGVAPCAEDIEQFVAARVPKHRRLSGGVRFVEALPMTRNTKLNRAGLKELALTEKPT